jgi:hypothetical protein
MRATLLRLQPTSSTARQRQPTPTVFETPRSASLIQLDPEVREPEELQPQPTQSVFDNTVRSNTVGHKFMVTVPSRDLSQRDRTRVEDSYRGLNDDGSYTWGYKSGDGSFKEETIGADCVTRGR